MTDKLSPEEVIKQRTADIADGVRAWIRTQVLVEEIGMPEALEPSGENLRTYMLSLEEEIHEFGREMNWRPWHSYKTISRQKALKEYADMMAFMALLGHYLMELTSATPDEIAQTYQRVSIANMTLLFTKRLNIESTDVNWDMFKHNAKFVIEVLRQTYSQPRIHIYLLSIGFIYRKSSELYFSESHDISIPLEWLS